MVGWIAPEAESKLQVPAVKAESLQLLQIKLGEYCFQKGRDDMTRIALMAH